MSYFGSTDFYLEVAKGTVAGHVAVNIAGHDDAIPTTLATVGEQHGNLYTYSATANIDTISSDNAADTHDITIVGLDINFAVVTQTVTLNGTTPVTLGTSLYRVNFMYNDILTTLTPTTGTIYLWVSGGGDTGGVPTVTADIRAEINLVSGVSSEHHTTSVYTVPAGHTAYIVFGKVTVTDTKALEMTFWGGRGQTVMQVAHHIDIKDTNYDYFFKLPLKVAATTDLEVRSSVDSGTAEVSVHYDIILVAD